MAKRRPKQPITALWLLEHADSPGHYVIALGWPNSYLALSSLEEAKAQAKHQDYVYGIVCVPVKFDVALSARRAVPTAMNGLRGMERS